MNIKITGGMVSGSVKAIPSKSYAHRISICNFLSGKSPRLDLGDFTSKDIEVTTDCLLAITNGERVLNCGESGSTLRFLLPLCGALGGEFTFLGQGKLLDRPNEELFSVLNQHGVSTVKTDVIKISGKLSSGVYIIRGDISSQYVSGLLMALPILSGDSQIILSSPLSSAPYVDITLEVLKNSGIIIDKTPDGFYVYGSQRYNCQMQVEGDWSNSAFFMAMGAINGDVSICGLNLDSLQGDKYILDVLKMANANVYVENSLIRVKKSQLKAFTFDAKDCPDLVPVCSALASFAQGQTVIKSIKRLKIKESDRVKSIIQMLCSFGISAKEENDCLIIQGGKHGLGRVDGFNDHRIVMSATTIATGLLGDSTILGAHAVNKSYPTFFNDYNLIGGVSFEV